MRAENRTWRTLTIGAASLALLLSGSSAALASSGEPEGHSISEEAEVSEIFNEEGFEEKEYGTQVIPADEALAAAEEVVGEDARFVSLEEASGELPVQPMAESTTIWAGGCGYRQGNDNPHHSWTTGSKNVSVHGYWRNMGGDCPTEADVTVYLQATACGNSGCVWTTVASRAERTTPGSGGGNRINARVACANESTVGYRALTDVDLPWIIDPGGQTESTNVNRQCTPAP